MTVMQKQRLSDTAGTNIVAVKGASTAPVVADPALVVTISPNSPATLATGASTLSEQQTQTTAINTLLKPSSTLTKVTTVDTITNPVAVTGTFFQATQPVSIAGTVTTTGGLTDTQLRATAVPVSLTSTAITNFPATQAISASSLPLPSGASTATLQTTGNTSLNSIDTKTPALGQALAAASVPVVLTAAQIATLTPPAAITGFALDTSVNSLLKPSSTLTAVTTVGAVTAITNALPTGANTIGAVTNANLDVALSTRNLEATQLLVKAKTDNLDVLLSTRLKPSDTLAGVTTVATVAAVTAITNALPAGANTIGNTNQTLATAEFAKITDGTNTATVRAASTAPLVTDTAVVVTLSPNTSTVATSFAKAEDTAHTTGDVGVMMLGVRSDTNGIKTSTDGDYSPISLDTYGNQRIVGDILHDSPDTGISAPVKIAGVALDTTYPVATTAGDITKIATDKQGRLITTSECSRGLKVFGQATLTTTTETTIIAGAGGTLFTDVSAIVVGNLGAGNENITFRFGVGGTIFAVVASLANTTQTVTFPVPVPASAVNLAITAQMNAASATGVSVTVVGVRNQ